MQKSNSFYFDRQSENYGNQNSTMKCSTMNKDENIAIKQNFWKPFHSNLFRSNISCSENLFRRFACFSLILIFIGVVIICVCMLYQMMDSGVVYFIDQDKASWSNWSPWSKCSESFGVASRNRTCEIFSSNSRTRCSGPRFEFIKCGSQQKLEPVGDSLWSQWSKWSPCSHHCQSENQIPLQSRHRACIDLQDKRVVESCFGETTEYRFCDWLEFCPKGQWTEWMISEPCHTRNRQSCGPGIQTLRRKCKAHDKCIGNDEKYVDCWSYMGCPVDIQPPKNVEMISNGNGNFNISWIIVPYGESPNRTRIYLTMINVNGKEIRTVSRDVIISPNAVREQSYTMRANFSNDLSNIDFHKLQIRLLTVNIIGKQSVFTDPIISNARAVDGQWESWGYWSDCSTLCAGRRGVKTRIRRCNMPKPSNGGKDCQGPSREDINCLGMEQEHCT